MTAPGHEAQEPPDGEPRPAAGPAGRRRRALLGLGAVATALVLLGLVVVIAQDRSQPHPLDADAPALADLTFHTKGCAFDPDRGGLVVHFAVSTADEGRFTVDVAAVTDQGADDLDVTTPHVVRFTVPFYGGQTRKEFDVVVPLSPADYQQGYQKCRYTLNGSQ